MKESPPLLVHCRYKLVVVAVLLCMTGAEGTAKLKAIYYVSVAKQCIITSLITCHVIHDI